MKAALSPAPAAEPARPRGRQSASNTRETILDAAEAQFADHGYDGVSLRQITTQAGVLLALISYYFAGKEDLFEEVIARRAEELNRRRRARLDALGGRDRPAEVAEIVDAFIRPLHELAVGEEEGWRNYARLIAQVAQADRWVELVQKHFDATATLYIDALAAACPGRPRPWLVRSFMFVVAVMVSAYTGNRRGPELIGSAPDRRETERTLAQMIPFLAAGIAAGTVAGPDEAGAKPIRRRAATTTRERK